MTTRTNWRPQILTYPDDEAADFESVSFSDGHRVRRGIADAFPICYDDENLNSVFSDASPWHKEVLPANQNTADIKKLVWLYQLTKLHVEHSVHDMGFPEPEGLATVTAQQKLPGWRLALSN